jgi:RNA polymerase sigma-70 factor, ECF subfamily
VTVSPSAAELVQRALAGEGEAFRPLVDALCPVVQARVARVILRSAAGRKQGRDLRQEVEDFTQEVFAALFADGARALRAWDPARGLSLVNFVGLLAEHQAASILRSGRRSPWTEEPMMHEDLDRSVGTAAAGDVRVDSRDMLERLLERLREELSPRGFMLFQLLLVEEHPADAVARDLGMSLDAVYAWRSRLGKLVRRLAGELESGVSEPRGARRNPKEREEQSAP